MFERLRQNRPLCGEQLDLLDDATQNTGRFDLPGDALENTSRACEQLGLLALLFSRRLGEEKLDVRRAHVSKKGLSFLAGHPIV